MNGTKRIRHIEPVGFYHGTQGTSREPMQREIAAQFEAVKAETREKFARVLKRIEARIEVLRDRKERAEARFAELVTETEGRRPELFAPAFWLALGLCAGLGEIMLIAPVLDGWGIADPDTQLFAAAVIVLTASGLFDRVLRRLYDGSRPTAPGAKGSRLRHVPTTLLAASALALLATFGWWRGNEMIFAALVSGGEWGAFLGRNPALTRVCVMILTLALPLFAALTMDWGFRELRHWIAWRRAERAIARFSKHLKRLPKRHEEETLALAEWMKSLDGQERQTVHSYLEHHELGLILGAEKERPIWIALRAAGLVLLLLMGWLLADPSVALRIAPVDTRLVLYLCSTAGVLALYLARALKRRERPTPRDLYRNRAVRWRGVVTAVPRMVRHLSANSGTDEDFRYDRLAE